MDIELLSKIAIQNPNQAQLSAVAHALLGLTCSDKNPCRRADVCLNCYLREEERMRELLVGAQRRIIAKRRGCFQIVFRAQISGFASAIKMLFHSVFWHRIVSGFEEAKERRDKSGYNAKLINIAMDFARQASADEFTDGLRWRVLNGYGFRLGKKMSVMPRIRRLNFNILTKEVTADLLLISWRELDGFDIRFLKRCIGFLWAGESRRFHIVASFKIRNLKKTLGFQKPKTTTFTFLADLCADAYLGKNVDAKVEMFLAFASETKKLHVFEISEGIRKWSGVPLKKRRRRRFVSNLPVKIKDGFSWGNSRFSQTVRI